jgi:hypothetical protein
MSTAGSGRESASPTFRAEQLHAVTTLTIDDSNGRGNNADFKKPLLNAVGSLPLVKPTNAPIRLNGTIYESPVYKSEVAVSKPASRKNHAFAPAPRMLCCRHVENCYNSPIHGGTQRHGRRDYPHVDR